MLFGLIVVLAVALVGLLFYQGYVSASSSAPGLADGKLTRCPDKPNCANSEYADDAAHFVEPISVSGDDGLARIRDAIQQLGGAIVDETPDYLTATFTSKLFRFVDDFEVRRGSEPGEFHVRSASRVGYSDMDVNRKRVAALREALVE